jgi:hypothetical protein
VGNDEQAQRRAVPLDVLRQPIRIRLIEICTEWERISPSEIVALGLCADIDSMQGKSEKQALTNIAYHCRKLREFGFLELVSEEPTRGTAEHFYSANSIALFEGDDWEGRGEGERERISRVVWHRLIAQVEDSMGEGLFDARKDRWLAWGPLDLDQEGWEELMDELSKAYDGIEAIRQRAAVRLKEPGAASIRASYALLGFESPVRTPMKKNKPTS